MDSFDLQIRFVLAALGVWLTTKALLNGADFVSKFYSRNP